MLNCDYKIFSKVITNQLQTILPDIIHPDQTGRCISENLIELKSIMNFCERNNKDAIIMAVDFQKAFDKVEWPALFRIIEAFNFGPNLIKLVNICLKDSKTVVLSNGNWTEFFPLSRGVKQGDPLAGSLFLLVIKVIGMKLRQNKSIKGIKINDEYTKLLFQYVDDLWTATEFEQRSFNAMLSEVFKFEAYSGLKINYDKTEIL